MFNSQSSLPTPLRGYGQPQQLPGQPQDQQGQPQDQQGQANQSNPYSRLPKSGIPFDYTDPESPEGRFLAAYRAMNPVRSINPFRPPDPHLTNALASLFGGGVSTGINAEAQLGLPGAQATAQNQFEDAELERRSSRMGQDLDQQRMLDEYSDGYLQRQQQGAAGGDRIRQLIERLRQQQGGGGQVQNRIGQLQERIGGGGGTPLLQALGLGQ